MSLSVPPFKGGDGTFSGILWTYDLNGNEPVCRHATINDRAHFLGRDECFAYNKKRSEVLKDNAKYGGKWRIPKMTTAETKVATPCVPQNQQHSNESQNYDNFKKCEEHKLEELANRIGARHEQPVYDEHESLKEHDDLKKQIAALSETLAVFRETIVDNTNCVGGIAHKLLMCERENKKSKDELKEALQKLEAAQFVLDELAYYRVVLYYSFRSKVVQNLHDKIPRIIELFQVLASNYDNITDRKNKHFDVGQAIAQTFCAQSESRKKFGGVHRVANAAFHKDVIQL